MSKRILCAAIFGGLWVLAVAGAQTPSPGTNTWKSSNGKYAVRAVGTTNSGSGPGHSGRTIVQVTGLAIDADGKETPQWQWAAPSGTGSFRVANGLVSDSGKRNVLITRTEGNPLTPAGEDIMPPQVVILDDKGQLKVSVTAATWWKALKMFGTITSESPPTLRFLEEEKMLEIKLGSGTTARVNTVSGELSVEKDPAGMSAMMIAEMARAEEDALHGMALKHPNPYIRETAYHDHDGDWTVDAAKGVFSLVIRDPKPRKVTGVVTLEDEGWRMKFDDEKKLTEEWTPPADVKLTAEQALAALADMCARWDFDMHLKACGKVLKDAVPVIGDEKVTFGNTARPELINWSVNLQERTFRISDGWVDVFHKYDGMFGLDKEKHWTAWPLNYTFMATQGGIRGSSALAIPKDVSPAGQVPPADGARK
jgi:hypothetical protein